MLTLIPPTTDPQTGAVPGTEHLRLDLARDVLPTEEDLTPAQTAALAAECAKPDYAAMTGAELLTALNRRREVENPEPRGRVPRHVLRSTLLTAGEIGEDGLPVNEYGELRYLWSRCKVTAMGTTDPALLKQQIAFIGHTDGLIADLREYTRINLEDPLVAQVMGTAVALGLCTQEDVAALTTVPDPDWRPLVLVPAPAETLFGPGAVVTRGDLVAAGCWPAGGD